MKRINEAVDQVRRMEQQENELLKNTRYLWLRNPENPTRNQKAKLGSLSRMNLKTVGAYNIKMSVKEFWEIPDLETVVQYLKKWYFWATHSRLEPITRKLLILYNGYIF